MAASISAGRRLGCSSTSRTPLAASRAPLARSRLVVRAATAMDINVEAYCCLVRAAAARGRAPGSLRGAPLLSPQKVPAGRHACGAHGLHRRSPRSCCYTSRSPPPEPRICRASRTDPCRRPAPCRPLPPQGLAHCFRKGEDGKLVDVFVIEPLSASSLECMAPKPIRYLRNHYKVQHRESWLVD
jgi:hypothetical protein